MESWIRYRRRQLRESLQAIRGKDTLRVFHQFGPNDIPISGVEFVEAGDLAFDRDPAFHTDIFFSKGYSPDIPALVDMRETGRAGIISCWFWDNHHLVSDCMRAAMLSDITFYAHYFKHYYLKNELAIDGAYAPLFPVFWTVGMVEEATNLAMAKPRSNALYGGYNSYVEFPQRDVLVNTMKAHIPDHALFMTPHGTPPDKHPYYGKSALDRLLEWMHYKVSLCIAFDGNMAMRMFDAMLGGGIPLLVGRPVDLDMMFSPELREELPILVVDSEDPAEIEAAYRKGLALFDQGGIEAARKRQLHVLGNHMLHHRLAFMINKIREIAENVEQLDTLFGGKFYPSDRQLGLGETIG